MRSTILIALVVLTGLAGAEIPQMISYQGKVTDASGNPVANGSYTMRFRIYNASTGGTDLWDSGAQTVSVSGGIFSVVLGESPQPAITLDFSQDYWLSVTFGGVDQAPRQRLASVGYAYMASGLVPGTEVVGSIAGNAFGARNNSSATDAAAVWASANSTTGSTHGLYATVHSPDGSAVFARGLASTGSSYGVFAQTSSTAGTAVYGQAAMTTGSGIGVRGSSAGPSGVGVYGYASSTTGYSHGVYGLNASTTGTGVRGTATATIGLTHGVRGAHYSTAGAGVYGSAEATTGVTHGVYGWSTSSDGRGVYGIASATTGMTYGVYGEAVAPGGRGVYGSALSTTGVAYGVFGISASTEGHGVYGEVTSPTGTTYGVRGHQLAPSGYGGYFHADSNEPTSTAAGVYGRTDADGVPTIPAYGVAGHAYYDGVGVGAWSYGGEIFQGYDGDYPGGTLRYYFLRTGWAYADQGWGSFLAGKDGSKKALYAVQSPEIWVEDFGTATLSGGRATVLIPADFASAVSPAAGYHVFLTPLGPSEVPLYVASKAADSFEVRSTDEKSTVSFDYRIVARRAGLETIRMTEVPVVVAPSKVEASSHDTVLHGAN